MAQRSHLSPMALSAKLRTFVAKAAATINWIAEAPFLFVADHWSKDTFELRAFMRATAGIAYARVFDVTDGAEVVQMQTASATLEFVTSGAATLIDAHQYRVEFGTTAGDAGGFTMYTFHPN